MKTTYLFKSERLGFRNWDARDFDGFLKLNTDPEVMRFFPTINDASTSRAAMRRYQKMYEERGYCYFAVDRLIDEQFIGFIGLCYQDYEASFTPVVDIGWRLDKAFWAKGYATEGALSCLRYGFQEIGLEKIVAIAPQINQPSIHVMQKIGMTKVLDFKHPKLGDYPVLVDCVCYEKLASQ